MGVEGADFSDPAVREAYCSMARVITLIECVHCQSRFTAYPEFVGHVQSRHPDMLRAIYDAAVQDA